MFKQWLDHAYQGFIKNTHSNNLKDELLRMFVKALVWWALVCIMRMWQHS